MSHLTEPWIEARKGLDVNEYSNRVIEKSDVEKYFSSICEDFNIDEPKDIRKYVEDLFKKLEKAN